MLKNNNNFRAPCKTPFGAKFCKSLFIFILLLGMTSCSLRRTCKSYPEAIEIPCTWQSPIENGVSLEDPTCFLWWRELDDPVLTSLVEKASMRNKDILLAGTQSKEEQLKTVNTVSAEVAKSYIELRGLQMRLKALEASIEAQNEIFTTSKGLSNRGFFSSIEENEDKKNLNSLLVEKSLIELSLRKTMYHLSTLLGYPPGNLYETLCQPQELPELPCEIPVGLPEDLICLNPTVQESKKAFDAAKNKQTFLSYQKAILSAFENTESALATFYYEREKFHYLENSRKIKAESYQLTKDLYHQGLKDEQDLLRTRQTLLSEENALIQSKVDLLISYILLYQTLGGGWEICCD